VGTDDLFKKRKARTAQEQARRKGSRAPYEKVLIVCEGEKTEPNYFRELIDFYEINTANVDGNCGSSPISIVHHAIARYADEKNTQVPYDKVYCVMDRDTHESFDEAIATLAKQKPTGVFNATVSVPCFEYWLLLHFHYTTAPFMAAGGKSAGDRVEVALKEFWPEYHKGKHGIFGHVLKDIEFAKVNAVRGLADAQHAVSNNPSTNVHELVSYLQNIKKKPE
jgi:hypothetical protein